MEFDIICKVVAEVMNVDPREVKPNTTFVDDLGADSLDLMQILMGVEEQFGVKFTDAEFGDIKTVKDAVEAIHNYCDGE